MKYNLTYLIVIIVSCSCFSQNTKDVSFLKEMDYLNHNVDCSKTSGSNIEHRICLNINLRVQDSIMLSRFDKYLNKFENDSLINKLKVYQEYWEEERKTLSLLKCRGLNGHSEAIIYMKSMLEITKLRVKSLDYFLEGN